MTKRDFCKQPVRVLFDASLLFQYYRNSHNRSGIFMTVYNIFLELKKRKDVELILYVDGIDCYYDYIKYKKNDGGEGIYQTKTFISFKVNP